MADFFKDLGSKLGDFGKVISEKAEVVSKKTEDTIEIQKMKSQIRGMERSNERDFQDMGEMIYEQFKKGKAIDSDFMELCEAIEEREAEMETLNKQVAEIKGLDVCKNCQEHLDASVVFCPKCGTKVDQEVVAEEAFEDGEVVAEEAIFDEPEVVEAELVEEDVKIEPVEGEVISSEE